MLKRLEIAGFKSFARKTVLDFSSSVTSVVGPNGSGKSNVAEAFRFALGEQSMKSMRGKRSEDLIWSGSHTTPRANRAAVAVVFDNTKRIFPKMEFDEVTIERAVFRDGQSEYAINGSKVRLRDVQELLAGANVGDTGHHIISQGEADRILTAHPRERRAMLEDALGLKAFEFKKQEAERKLEKTEDNVREVEALRREIAPHIRFLQKQVERLERAEELAKELRAACQTYFAIEEVYIRTEKEKAIKMLADTKERLAVIEADLSTYEERATNDTEGMKRSEAVRQTERELDRLMQQRGTLAREVGRIEGALQEAKRRSVAVMEEPYIKIPREDMIALREEMEKHASISRDSDPTMLHAALQALKGFLDAFFARFASHHDDFLADEEQAVHRLEKEREQLSRQEAALGDRVDAARAQVARAREASLAHEETGREQNRRLIDLAESKAKLEGEHMRLEGKMGELEYLAEDLEQGRREAIALVGHSALSFEQLQDAPQEDRRAQEDRKRGMERLKIRVEEAGGSGEDVRKEYTDATERETFLARELEDLAKSAAGLRTLIDDLDTELQKSFAEGLAKVNTSFGEFFSLMFGGGGARLVLEEFAPIGMEEDDEDEEVSEVKSVNRKPGIEISVNLPKKRVQALMQLSGGERALTSIALIFAMSQVNPPPFLILDETDAALDEANSRRYGDMIENLSKKSQLIVITHNRETMSRAGILYGVTMGGDGISKLLSVKFEEATAVAK
ncbi:MAG: Smc, chromosome segregation ATPase, chromosome segregation protein [Parcubacteria group bacterium]|nr:Smc, chromosome segregation ATPase, chromosome segregation protein [Parcubacteria group bacterium]